MTNINDNTTDLTPAQEEAQINAARARIDAAADLHFTRDDD